MASSAAAIAAEVEWKATIEHCAACFQSLLAYLQGSSDYTTREFEGGDRLCPFFVTWYIPGVDDQDWQLRGCLGTFTADRVLREALPIMARRSATADLRFHPVGPQEVPLLKCHVSLLGSFEPAGRWDDWIVGVHGTIISFTDPVNNQPRRAVFLPEVAAVQGWDHEATIAQLLLKSGYTGAISDQLLALLDVTRFQSTIASLTYADYVRTSMLQA